MLEYISLVISPILNAINTNASSIAPLEFIAQPTKNICLLVNLVQGLVKKTPPIFPTIAKKIINNKIKGLMNNEVKSK